MRVNGFCVEVIHAVKVDLDDKAHKLPDGIAVLDEHIVADYFCPDEWSKDGRFILVEEDMPLWFDLRGNMQRCACLMSIQKVNPITGKPAKLDDGLQKNPEQNYLVLPEQQWIDGYPESGKVVQFRVTKQGQSLAVNEFVLPPELQDSHAIAFAFFLPKRPEKERPVVQFPSIGSSPWAPSPSPSPMRGGGRGRRGRLHTGAVYGSSGFGDSTRWQKKLRPAGACCNISPPDDEQPQVLASFDMDSMAEDSGTKTASFDDVDEIVSQSNLDALNNAAMGAGGRIEQEIITDPNTVEYYQEKPAAVLILYMALPALFQAIMAKGKRQDASRKDKYVNSAEIGGVQVPLMK